MYTVLLDVFDGGILRRRPLEQLAPDIQCSFHPARDIKLSAIMWPNAL